MSIDIPGLQPALLQQLQGKLKLPAYDPSATGIGIVHIGPGAFFRAHQAWYTDLALKYGGDWGISVVSMRSNDLAKALTTQQGLYSLVLLDKKTEYQVVGSIRELLVAAEQYEQVLQRLAAPSSYYVTLTITEKGYCLNTLGELDLTHADIQHDLETNVKARSAIGLLVQALALRFAANVPPFVVLSCDNLTDNGHKLRNALLTFARQKQPALANWLEQQLLCPCTMVDSITPATDEMLPKQLAAELGYQDNWPIKREKFCQWVIEDILPAHRPAWHQVGVTYTQDVKAFEKAKLRLLNAPHSALAYLGSLCGLDIVFDAMQQPKLRNFVQKLAQEEIIGSFHAPAELNPAEYSADIFQRFDNPAIRHLLAQIAWDGSQKLPMRVFPIILDNLASGRSIRLLSLVVASWLLFIRLRYQQQPDTALVDPLAAVLLGVAAQCRGDAAADTALFLALSAVFPAALQQSQTFKAELTAAYQQLCPLLLLPQGTDIAALLQDLVE
ncbi:mannitol dehydrogenase family protein [Rheinheimera sp. MM224]|uniref:mannitol dehydrogenase family protein n=1 Tax=Rheinheimera sp. MM224 TaxID=3019969 RepID=UPI0021F8565C|nr:mannitol dehydrogenase family protein [Rheinheimera sp. MM224]CAI3793606.1 Altronate oxidoreductase [Rheinheimera sp. MM224]